MTGPKDLGNLPSHQDTPLIFHDLSELQIGECVVHIDHGIGRYQGLTTLDMNGQTAEFLTLLYQNDDKLYVPLEDLNRLSPYTHVNPEQVQLHKLGTDRWSKSKEKALGRMRDAAADLLALYAARSLQLRKPYELNLEDYEAFSAQFPYTETEDQSRAIQAILQDMTSPHPMDRVLCGDVGFGKTEVALRAAFIAVTNHHQVAVLVPTTLLCQQHFENFQERFAQWPIKIESMSRFKTAHQLAQVKADLHAGKIDIVIGTHALLSSDVHFASLGLVIVDEEHRFGVRHKEQLKKLRHQIDILSMTATPIPRTLNMALSGVRDLSIISTPPAKRLSVQTFVREYHPDIIKEAILREIYRGGQVYFLHNEVDTIQHQRDLLTQLLPDVRCEIAHGQMPERQLERLMHDFYHNRFQVLLCTTIIETGIDVQNANTIIMNRADRLGLAQMHQLRGRVGRSYHQAYAYLLTPPIDTLPTDAKKRLEALCDANSLGAGFTLAQHDLDIRGAGALLGEEQSGQIEAMGYELYIDLLQVTTRALQRGEALDYETLLNKHTTQIDLGIPHLFPETYMADIHLRLKYYQQLARVLSDTDIYHIKSEVIDRFGKLPEPSEALFALTELRVYAAARGITHISGHRQSIKITFAAPPHCAVDPAKIISMIQRHPQKYKLAGSQALSILGDFQTPAARLQAVKESLEALFQHP